MIYKHGNKMEADSKEHTVLIYFYSVIFSHHSPTHFDHYAVL